MSAYLVVLVQPGYLESCFLPLLRPDSVRQKHGEVQEIENEQAICHLQSSSQGRPKSRRFNYVTSGGVEEADNDRYAGRSGWVI